MARKRSRGRSRQEDPMRMTRETVNSMSNLMVGIGGLTLAYGVTGGLMNTLKK